MFHPEREQQGAPVAWSNRGGRDGVLYVVQECTCIRIRIPEGTGPVARPEGVDWIHLAQERFV
jgi:hypothetical protein